MTFAADNGLNPIWNENCEFEVVNPDCTFLRFVVQEVDMFGDNGFIGQATYPVSLVLCRYHVPKLIDAIFNDITLKLIFSFPRFAA